MWSCDLYMGVCMSVHLTGSKTNKLNAGAAT